ncbi:hypothetical protein HNP55_001375 [Paucibacter oligotrophus]|uniref:ABC-2 type transport system permease protein n=1 Tax=Roseateles oligotrophus TaxID=1769250 RepID=A0A840L3S9_9BURK|nr:hypothetical protein [Roseateles oligotrophus]MBB4842860.1 hypothetical protein [Roseateles oligotrophus]
MNAFSSSRFSTLLLREWMQHKRGWLITLFLPLGLFFVLLPFGQVQGMPIDQFPLQMAVALTLATAAGVFGITWISAMFQMPGLARRDVQDRSIEFWLSLPASHSESIGATLLAHALLVPLAALLVGAIAGPLMASGLFIKQGGFAAWASVPWGTAIAATLPILLRAVLGVLLMTLWLSPLIMLVVAASAWLKRWGVPAVVLTLGLGGLALDQFYNWPIVEQLLERQLEGASQALLSDHLVLGQHLSKMAEDPSLPLNAGALAAHDAWLALQALASPHFIGGLALAALCFGLLVLKRSRSH